MTTSPSQSTTAPGVKHYVFRDHHGNKSCGRIMSFSSLVAATVIIIADLIVDPGVQNVPESYTVALIAGAFGSKAIQKFAEK